jgi:phenylalanyl-tRNA synthetase alpha subunit
MLYRLAQDGFKPAKYFSIDRVFRNEAIDRTHLAEFHQVEGDIRREAAQRVLLPEYNITSLKRDLNTFFV